MPLYLTEARFSHATLTMVEPPEERPAAVARLMAAHGGRLHHIHGDAGDDVLLAVYEMPDEQAANEVLAAILGGTPAEVHTTRLGS